MSWKGEISHIFIQKPHRLSARRMLWIHIVGERIDGIKHELLTRTVSDGDRKRTRHRVAVEGCRDTTFVSCLKLISRAGHKIRNPKSNPNPNRKNLSVPDPKCKKYFNGSYRVLLNISEPGVLLTEPERATRKSEKHENPKKYPRKPIRMFKLIHNINIWYKYVLQIFNFIFIWIWYITISIEKLNKYLKYSIICKEKYISYVILLNFRFYFVYIRTDPI